MSVYEHHTPDDYCAFGNGLYVLKSSTENNIMNPAALRKQNNVSIFFCKNNLYYVSINILNNLTKQKNMIKYDPEFMLTGITSLGNGSDEYGLNASSVIFTRSVNSKG